MTWNIIMHEVESPITFKVIQWSSRTLPIHCIFIEEVQACLLFSPLTVPYIMTPSECCSLLCEFWMDSADLGYPHSTFDAPDAFPCNLVAPHDLSWPFFNLLLSKHASHFLHIDEGSSGFWYILWWHLNIFFEADTVVLSIHVLQ